jgi:hypothetical protein
VASADLVAREHTRDYKIFNLRRVFFTGLNIIRL